MRLRVGAAVIAATFAALALATSSDALAKKGKVHLCYVAKGHDRGAMRFAGAKRCRRGEKSLVLNKRGKRGKPGPAGPSGQTGPIGPAGATGPAGSAAQDTIDQLQSRIEQQNTRIEDLEGQVSQLSTQYSAVATQLGTVTGQVTGLGTQFGAFQTTACDQLGALTDQSNDLGAAIDGISLTGVLAGLTWTNPGAPTGLSPFSC